MDSRLELPLRSTLLALLMKRESPGGLSPEPPALPVAGELIVGDNSGLDVGQLRMIDIDLALAISAVIHSVAWVDVTQAA